MPLNRCYQMDVPKNACGLMLPYQASHGNMIFQYGIQGYRVTTIHQRPLPVGRSQAIQLELATYGQCTIVYSHTIAATLPILTAMSNLQPRLTAMNCDKKSPTRTCLSLPQALTHHLLIVTGLCLLACCVTLLHGSFGSTLSITGYAKLASFLTGYHPLPQFSLLNILAPL